MKDNIFFILAHPIQTLRAKSRQVGVAIEHASPPAGSNFEDFPELPVQDAAKLMFGQSNSGVRLEDWSPSDQERLKKGLKPVGHPEHPNI